MNQSEYLDEFIVDPDQGFKDVFSKMQSAGKNDARALLIYISKVMDNTLEFKEQEIKFSYIHLDGIDEKLRSVLAEFVVIKLFLGALAKDAGADNGYIATEIIKAGRLIKEPMQIPSGIKGKSKRIVNIKKSFDQVKITKSFFEEIVKINPKAGFCPNTIMNVLEGNKDYLYDQFQIRPYCTMVEDIQKRRSYVLINSDLARDELDRINLSDGKGLLDEIENIILFDCEGRKIHRDLNYKELNEWKKNYQTNLKNLLILSFEDGPTYVDRLKNQLERTLTRFFSVPQFPKYESYTITRKEVQYLLGHADRPTVAIEFFGTAECTFWEELKIILNTYEGLYELRSFHMMNVYSLVLNGELLSILINDIFEKDTEPKFISAETKETLNELSTENVAELRSYFTDMFNWILKNGWYVTLSTKVTNTVIIIPATIERHPVFSAALKKALHTEGRTEFSKWSDISKHIGHNVTILEYRDHGPFPYSIRPNIFDLQLNGSTVRGLFLSHFFKLRAEWSQFNAMKDLNQMIDHPFRRKSKNWLKFNQVLLNSRPGNLDQIDWDEEKNYSPDTNIATVKIKFSTGGKRTFPYSELFIVQPARQKNFLIRKAEELLKWNFQDEPLLIQQLESLYANFNIYDKLANIERERAELKVIMDNYGLMDNEDVEMLWKILLKRKIDSSNEETIMAELKEFLSRNRLGMVSQHTFVEIWSNPDSPTRVPRGTRNFIKICEYVGLSRTYVRIMLRLRNAEMQTARSSSKQMNNLITELINDGAFNQGNIQSAIIAKNKNRYKQNHKFDEIGISEEHLVSELSALVELLIPQLKMIPVKNIENNQL